MFAQNSLFDLPSLDSVIDRTPVTATPKILVVEAIALMSQAKENSCELEDTSRSPTVELLNREQNSCILVVEAGKLIGIFTERDAVKLAADQRDLNGIEIAQVMTRKLVTLKRSPNQTIFDALSLLDRWQIHHLPILDERGELEGLITQTDLLQAIDPVELWNVINLLQQQIDDKTASLEQEISRQQQAEAELKQINDGLEMQVQERTAELTDFIENAVVPMHWVTSDGTISWANQAELDMLGYTKEEYIGRSIVEFHADRPVIDKLLRQLSNNEAVQNYQARLRCKDGSIRDVVIDSNVSWRNGKFAHTRCFTRDISEQKQADSILQETLRSLKFQNYALDRAAIVAITDRQGTITYANEQFCQISKYAKAELIGQTHRIINSGYHPAEFFQELWITIANGQVWQGEIKNRAKDGSFYWVDTTIVPFLDETGKPFQYLAIRFDISDRKQAEEKIRESQRYLSTLIDNLPGYVYSVANDPNYTPEFISEGVFEITGYRQEEYLIEQTISCGQDIHPEDRDHVWNIVQEAVAAKQPYECEYRIITKAGNQKWVWERGQGIYDDHGELMHLEGFVTDISDLKHREVERQQAEIQLREISNALSHAVEGISRLDPQGGYIFVNEAYASMLGYTVEEMIGMSWQITVHRDDLEAVRTEYQQMLRAGKVELETRGIRKDGSIFYKQLFMICAYNEQQEFIGHYCFAKDISDRKEAEEALRRNEQKFRAIFDGTFGFIGLLTTEGILIEANRTALEAINAEPADVIGQPFWQAPWWSHSPQLQQQLQQAITTAATGELVRFEAEHILADGTSIFVDFSLKPVFDQAGKVVMLIPEGRDISDRKQAEQTIREQAALLDLTTDAIIVRDLEGEIQFWNQGAARIYGWQTTEAIGQNVRSLLYEQTSAAGETAHSTVLEVGSWQGELRKVTKTGKEVIVASRWTLVRDEANNPRSILSVDTDITEQKLLEIQFLRTQRLESLGTLAGGIAHDLNNILAPILGFSKLLPLKLTDVDEQTKGFFKIIETNAQRGAALVKQILTFARGMEGERGSVQVRHLITEIKQIIEQTFPKTIELETSVSKNLWTVNADVNQLHQVLMNLVVNARDAMPLGGKLKITAENFPVNKNFARLYLDAQVGAYILITVADTGLGIPAEIIDRIFEPFFTTKEIDRGTGLGLSTLIGIVKSHGGFVDVVSNTKSENRGTQFKVFLPASEMTETNPEETEPIPQGNSELILVVDDEPSILEVTKATLETYNYRVLTASNGIEAIAIYAQNQNAIKLVIMDIMMPSMDGKTAISILKTINSQAKIIAVSGLVSDREIIAELTSSIEAFVAKPYTNNDLLRAIDEVIN